MKLYSQLAMLSHFLHMFIITFCVMITCFANTVMCNDAVLCSGVGTVEARQAIASTILAFIRPLKVSQVYKHFKLINAQHLTTCRCVLLASACQLYWHGFSLTFSYLLVIYGLYTMKLLPTLLVCNWCISLFLQILTGLGYTTCDRAKGLACGIKLPFKFNEHCVHGSFSAMILL